MKKIALGLSVMLLVLCGCAPTSKIAGTWKNEKHNDKKYKTVFIAVLSGHAVAKSVIEDEFGKAFNAINVSATKSIDEFPPKFSKDSLAKDEIMKKVKQKGCDAILTISILKQATESRYVNGVYSPWQFGYYNNFWGYYSYWYPYVYAPDYYTNEVVYYMEANVYDIGSEELVWSAQSKTYYSDNLKPFTQEFAKAIVSKLQQDGLLNATPNYKKNDVENLSHNK